MAGADLPRDLDDVIGLVGDGPPVHRHGDPRLRLDDLGRQLRLELGGGRRHRDQIRLDARVDRVLAVDRLLHPVEADEREPVDREVASQKADRTSADDRHAPESGGETLEYRQCVRQRPRVGGVLDHR